MEINFIAVGLAALVPMIMGFIYYHPKVLGNLWMKSNGFTLESIGNGPKPYLFGVALVLSVLLAFFVTTNVTGPGQETAPDGHSFVTFKHGMAHGILLTLSFVLPILGTSAIFEKRSLSWVLVNAGYWLLTLMIMGGIISAWRA